jgi:probable addiction module antidote protein
MKKSAKAKKPALRPFDAAEFLTGAETIAAYLDEAFASNDPAEIAESIGTVARALGMSKIARGAKVSRESLYRALSRNGNPELSTIIGVLRACGVTLAAKAA